MDKASDRNGLLFKLDLIIWTVAFVLTLPLALILCIPIAIYRKLVEVSAKINRPDLARIVPPTQQAIFHNDFDQDGRVAFNVVTWQTLKLGVHGIKSAKFEIKSTKFVQNGRNCVEWTVNCSFYIPKTEKKREKAKRKCWTKAWILRRMELGIGSTLFRELAAEEPNDFRNWIRMDETAFYDILSKIRPFIERKNTPMRLCISAEERLAVTLRFMATGEDFKALHYQFRIRECTVSRIAHETASAIYFALKDECLSVPSTNSEWCQIAKDYWDQWQFPNCIGSLDGKHVRILPPPSSGSDYRNYKGFFSLVLMALVKSNYEFIYVDVGTNGRISDGGVWGKCALRSALESNQLNIPQPANLPRSDKIVPHLIVADEAFGLKDYLMRPYPGRDITQEQRIYYYRLSRARRVVENSFGILENRWRFLLGTLNVTTTERACNLVLAACTLHNYLTRHTSSKRIYMPENLVDQEDENGNIIPGTWRQDYPTGTYERPAFSGSRSGGSARHIQSMFKDFFNNEGSEEWQYNRL